MPPLTPPQSFAVLDNPGQIDALVDASFEHPVLLVKHSPACGASFRALDELEAHRDRLEHVDVYVVDVLQHRRLSQALAARFGVRHESPQVLLIVNGGVRWHTSHYGVTADGVQGALAALSPVA
jgi:bacillithiol system protein YtxJ